MMHQFLNTSLTNVKPSAIRQFSQLAKEKKGCIGLTLGEPDFDTPLPIGEAAKLSIDGGDTHYIENNGDANLRQAIVDFEKAKNGLEYGENEVIVTVGATGGLFTALFGILNPDDEVIVPTPAFGLYESIIAMCRAKFVQLDTSTAEFQITKEALNSLITDKTKAIILNSPNNPTGCILTQESLQNVLEIVKEKNIFVICDDVYNQLIYTENCPSFAKFQEVREKIIIVQSFSKPYAMTGWRMGYLLADLPVKLQLQKVHQFSVVSSSSISQKACIEALKQDITPMLEVYEKRRDFVLSRLAEMKLEFVIPQGGFYVFPSIRKFGMSSGDFCRKMIDEALLAVTPGFCFGSDEHIRLTYCYSDEQLKEGMNRLESFIKTLEVK
ncbi:MAG: aminotransferase class I/II-fold pyridoxal phosphate-dependent enzyme [Clostridia bacterium]